MKIRKWLILALVLVVVLTSSVTAQALKEPKSVNRGVCGANSGTNLSWKLNSHGLLTISGNGAMRDYLDGPFYFLERFVNKAVIEYGATNIGSLAFAGCTATEISIPESVTAIGSKAFSGCVNVEELVIPDSVTKIGYGAFASMRSMQHIQLPSNITGIESLTFSGCSALTTLVIPEGVTYIDEEAFRGCTRLRTIVLPASLTTIGRAAFIECDNLWHIIYTGTQEQWEQIQVDPSFNDSFFNATTHVVCTGQEVTSEVTENSTCTAKGKITLTCSVCDTKKTVATEKSPHRFDYVCHGFCTVCGEAGESKHYWNWGDITKEPNCTEDGIRIYSCNYCEDTKEKVVEKNGKHVYDHKCDKECNICGKTRSTSHKWDEGAVTQEPTCKDEGVIAYTCTACKETKTEPIDKLTTHTYDHACDTDCNICGEMRTTSHVPGEPATENTDQLCTECGAVLTPATGPAPTEPTQPDATTAPTDPTETQATQPSTDATEPTAPVIDPVESDNSNFAIVVILIIGATIGAGVLLIVLRKKS